MECSEADTVVGAEQQCTALQIVLAVEGPLEVEVLLVSLLAQLPWQRAEQPLGLPQVEVVLAGALLVVLSAQIPVEVGFAEHEPLEVGFAEHEPLFSDSCS